MFSLDIFYQADPDWIQIFKNKAYLRPLALRIWNCITKFTLFLKNRFLTNSKVLISNMTKIFKIPAQKYANKAV